MIQPAYKEAKLQYLLAKRDKIDQRITDIEDKIEDNSNNYSLESLQTEHNILTEGICQILNERGKLGSH